MIQLKIHHFDLRLKHTFRLSHEVRTVQPTIIVELIDQDGNLGFGEATATTYYGMSIKKITQDLEKLRPWLASITPTIPEDLYPALEAQTPNNSFVRCAIDVALHDLWARRHHQPLYKMWKLTSSSIPTTSYTIGIAPIPEMIQKLKEQPWPIYKIKLGTANDLQLIKSLREHTDAIFRVDANTAWSVQQTQELAPLLQNLGVEFIEQPLPVHQWKDYKELYSKTPLPIIADESCQTENDINRCAKHFDGVNIKLVKCGGLTPARRMIQRARQLGLKVMIGCMTESTIGISAIAQLAPLLDYVDMDGALLLAEDPATGVYFDQHANFHYGDLPGTGAMLKN